MWGKVLMPIRITRRNKWNERREGFEPEGLSASLAGHPKASYMDSKDELRILLSGSTWLLLGV